MRSATLLPLAALAAACFTGPGAATFGPANSPRGLQVTLRVASPTGRGDVRGELLEVRDTAMLVLRDRQVTLVPLTAIRGIRTGGYYVGYRSGRPGPVTLARLRAVSRFPGGIPPAALRQLLEHAGQAEVLVVGSP
jgi:hypothetical protein